MKSVANYLDSLNYNKFFTEGINISPNLDDYHSHNTRRLEKTELITLLNRIGYKN